MVREIGAKQVLNGFEPVRAQGPAERHHGKPAHSFEAGAPSAPRPGLPGNSLFAARDGMYANMSPAQQAEFKIALENCRPQIAELYGQQAYEAVAGLLAEVMEFTGKVPA